MSEISQKIGVNVNDVGLFKLMADGG